MQATITLSRRWHTFALLGAFDLLYALTLALPGVWPIVPARNTALITLGVFLVLQLTLLARPPRAEMPPAILSIRRNHYLQGFFLQASFMAYWGLYWPLVSPHFKLVLVQLGFAVLFDSLCYRLLRGIWRFSFAPVPVVMSTNLFLWFVPEYFWAQLLVVALAIVGKATLQWHRFLPHSGAPLASRETTHIFNPTGLALALSAIVILSLMPTDIAYGQSVPASQELGPHVYSMLFAISILVNVFFPTVLVTASIVATTLFLHFFTEMAWGLPAYPLAISAPVFLAAVLLVTDPMTTPITKTGRVLFGASYAAIVYVIPYFLIQLNLPSSSEKVLAVPLVNLLVPTFDRIGEALETGVSSFANLRSHRLHRVMSHRGFHLAVWTAFFLTVNPGLKTVSPCLLHLPAWVLTRTEYRAAKHAVDKHCQENPRACSTYGFAAEIAALRNGRPL